MTRLLSAAEASQPTYAERGATLTSELPEGYHHLGEGTILGDGSETFAKASEGLRAWKAHQLRGVGVFPADAPLRTCATVVVTLGGRIAGIAAACRIIAVVDEPGRFGPLSDGPFYDGDVLNAALDRGDR